jgi:hypothetical protein
MDIQKELERAADSADGLFHNNLEFNQRVASRGFITLTEHDTLEGKITAYREQLSQARKAFEELTTLYSNLTGGDIPTKLKV